MFTGLFSQWSFLNFLCNSGCWIIFPIDWFWLTSMKISTPNSYLGHYQLKSTWAGVKVEFSCSVMSNSVIPWTAAHQASLAITNSQSSLKLMSIESVMASNHLILCRPFLLLPSIFFSIRVFSKESVLHIRRPSIGVSALASVLPVNIQDWSPLGWTGLTSLQSQGLSRVFSNTTVQKHQFFGAHFSLYKGKRWRN